jgi:hypothetical protein
MRELLSALMYGALARLPLEPNLHDKRMLGQHAYEDALSLADLGGPVAGVEPPEGDLRELLIAELGAAALDEPRALLLRRQERHVLELPSRLIEPPSSSMPARDPFVEIGTETPGPHADLNQALIVAEAAAATAAETPFATTLELAALAAAKLDETAAIEATLEEPWGTQPVDVAAYGRLMDLPLDDRVEQLLRERTRSDEDAAG